MESTNLPNLHQNVTKCWQTWCNFERLVMMMVGQERDTKDMIGRLGRHVHAVLDVRLVPGKN